MKFTRVFAVLAFVAFVLACQATASVYQNSKAEMQDRFLDYVKVYDKTYVESEFHKRYLVFRDNAEYIDAHNSNPKSTYTMKLTDTADLTYEEFAQKYLMNDLLERDDMATKSEMPEEHKRVFAAALKNSVKDDQNIDLRDRGIIPEIVDQGACGSCWAFSAVAGVDFAFGKRIGSAIKLSDQQVLSCSGAGSCNGGWKYQALDYVLTTGLVHDEDIPYEARDLTCDTETIKSKPRFTPGGYVAWDTPETRVGVVDKMVSTIRDLGLGLVVSVYVNNDFRFYSDGVFQGDGCPTTSTNHAVAVVGYGTEGGHPYWIVRNSWGKSWGDDGHIKIVRGKSACAVEYTPGYVF